MITIDQLLESVDLDFEPGWVTKDDNGDVYIFENAPKTCKQRKLWVATVPIGGLAGYEGLKLAEFENKPWAECIYEVPRKTTGKIEKVEGYTTDKILAKVNELVVAVNKHADIIQQIGDWGNSKGECLWCETLTKFEPNGLKGAKNE